MTSRELGYCGGKGGGGEGRNQILETSHSAILPILKGETCLHERISNIFSSILFDIRTQTLALDLLLVFYSSNNVQNHSPFLFIRGLSCPRCVQTSLTQNCPKLTILRFPYNLLLVSCGDIGDLKHCVS